MIDAPGQAKPAGGNISAVPPHRLLVLLGISLVLSNCAPEQPEAEAPPPRFEAIAAEISGTVFDPDRRPVPGAFVTVTMFGFMYTQDDGPRYSTYGGDRERGDCWREWQIGSARQTQTGPDGGFVVTVDRGLSRALDVCADVEIAPPPGTGLQQHTVTDVGISIAPEGSPRRQVDLEIVLGDE